MRIHSLDKRYALDRAGQEQRKRLYSRIRYLGGQVREKEELVIIEGIARKDAEKFTAFLQQYTGRKFVVKEPNKKALV